MSQPAAPFDLGKRIQAIQRMAQEEFDLLIIGGGITGVAVARDAVQRGLKVALVEKNDFASGTSSRSTKLIHGGLRYLENFEFHLVFEALFERTWLLKALPTLVRPLPFYFPVYEGERPGRLMLGAGMWFYDLLALFRAPKMHRYFSKQGLLKEIPGLRAPHLLGGFRYYDASMWDDVMTVELARAAAREGAVVANYVEAQSPIRDAQGEVVGWNVRDRLAGPDARTFSLRAKRVVACTGPFIDQLGVELAPHWKPRLKPSKGVHLVVSLKRLPLPGAVVMAHPEDHRIAFAIARPDYGDGVVLIGTTDGPTPADPSAAKVERADVTYLLDLVNRSFPEARLTEADVLSTTVGVRPLVAPSEDVSLSQVSREHHIEEGPGGVVWVAGGKYTTHRPMAREIVDRVLEAWEQSRIQGRCDSQPERLQRSRTQESPLPDHTAQRVAWAREIAKRQSLEIPEALWERFGAESLEVAKLRRSDDQEDPAGFPWLDAQFRFLLREGMIAHLEDFACRRIALSLARADHGMPYMKKLSEIWAHELGRSPADGAEEVRRYEAAMQDRESWRR